MQVRGWAPSPEPVLTTRALPGAVDVRVPVRDSCEAKRLRLLPLGVLGAERCWKPVLIQTLPWGCLSAVLLSCAVTVSEPMCTL